MPPDGVAVATVLLVMFARSARAEARARFAGITPAPAHQSAGPEWFDVTAGVLLILEAVHSTHSGGNPLYHHALLYLGIVTVASGLASGKLADRLSRRRFIRLDHDGVHASLSRFRKFDLAWSEVTDLQLRDDAIILVSSAGRQLIPLHRYANAKEIAAAFSAWSARLTPRIT